MGVFIPALSLEGRKLDVWTLQLWAPSRAAARNLGSLCCLVWFRDSWGHASLRAVLPTPDSL